MKRVFSLWRATRGFFRHYGDALSLGALALALFAVATNTQTGWLFLFCAFLLAALVYHGVIGRRELRGARASLHACPHRPLVGHEGVWELVVEAPRANFRYPLLVELPRQEFEPEDTPTRFLAWTESGQAFRFATSFHQRGPIPGLDIRLHSWAPFAWFATCRDMRLTTGPGEPDILVLPTGPRLELDLPASAASREGVSSTSARSGQWGDLRRLRDYASGDDPRWVHWASTARLGRLVIREHSQQTGKRVTLLIDGCCEGALTDDALVRFERLISWAASLLEWALRRGHQLEVCLNNADAPHTYSPVSQPLEALARVQLQSVEGEVAFSATPSPGVGFWFTLRPEAGVPLAAVTLDFSQRSVYAVDDSAHPQAVFREALGRWRGSRSPGVLS